MISEQNLNVGPISGARKLAGSALLRDQTEVSQHAGLRPEIDLLFACARTQVNQAIDERVRALLELKIDWAFVIEKARQHCVMPLLCWNLCKLWPQLVPDSILRQLHESSAAHARRNLLQTAELIEVVGALDAEKIQALAFKGPALAAQVYGNLSLRQYGDLDILVHESDLNAAINVLLARGYQLENAATNSRKFFSSRPRGKDVVLTNATRGIRVELHWRLSGAHFSFPLNLRNLWDELDEIDLASTRLRCLKPNELLIYLSLHGSRHSWERLGWVCDVAEVIRAYPDLDWPQVLRRARSLGCERSLLLSLMLASELFDAEIPFAVKQKLAADQKLRVVAVQVCKWFFREAEQSLTLSEWYLYHLWLKERQVDKLRLHIHYSLRYLRLALRPNQRDHAIVLLPASVSFLYYLVRPLRLIRERVFRS